ncbi:inorganic phosphate transporter [Fodinicola feengrottensis]|uniref:Phosphate transporter n=1 Tax=Fodinicola feengrottensis TaxID=435914 RepID=A0ABN2H0G8_9ACTN|nr:inorganic phosphate transporter [Fodinicola feengrottensis]
MTTGLIIVVVVTALAFDFTNGFHDTANAMATSIATGALKPRIAVLVSAVLNLVGAFLSISVAATIASGVVDAKVVTPQVVFAGLVGAIAWNLVTWYLGLPSSSSHALIGGVVGATLVAVGPNAVKFAGIISKVLVPAVISPLLAGLVAGIATYVAYKLTDKQRQSTVKTGFRIGQIASASLVSLAHGTNDAQKTMGVITLAMITAGLLPANSAPPVWVILAAGLSIAAGTYIGGWRVIRTLGKGLTEIESPQGFAAETASAVVILASSHAGFPLSTTHVCSGGIIGAGVGKRLARVHWGVAGKMAVAWLLTLPAAAIVGALVGQGASLLGAPGIWIMAVVVAAFGFGIYLLSRRNSVSANNVNDSVNPPQPVAVATGVGA